jgi:hypothetical protein
MSLTAQLHATEHTQLQNKIITLVCECGLFNDAGKISVDTLSSYMMVSKAKLPWLN